jgi:hypothetical protein
VRRAVRISAYGVAALAALALAAALVLPQLLDRPRMAAEIQAKLSQAVKAEVRWSNFDVRILPWPQGMLRGLRVETTTATFSTDEMTVALRLWPLLFGRAEITSLDIERPALRLTVVPAAAVPEEARLAPEKDALAAYRSVMSAVIEALQAFAPDTTVTVNDADVRISVEGLPPMEASQLALRARTSGQDLRLETSARSRYWTSMKLAGRIRYADLSSTAELQLSRVQGQAWLDWALESSGVQVAIPDVDLTARWRADAAKALELELDGGARTLTLTRAGKRVSASPIVLKARAVADAKDVTLQVARLGLGASGVAGGELRYVQKEHSLTGDLGYSADLAQALAYGRELAPGPLARIESASGSLSGRFKLALREERRFGVTVEKSNAAVQVKELAGALRLAGAAVEIDSRGIRAERVALSAAVGEAVAKARYAFKDGSAAAEAEFELGLPETLALVRAMLPDPKALEVVEFSSGRVRGTAKAELSKTWTATAQIAQSDAQAKLAMLPAPLALSGAMVRATPKTVSIERAQVRLMESGATASATITDFAAGPTIEASVAQASIGPKVMAWIWQTAGLAPGLEPKTPLRLSVSHMAWSPRIPLDVRGEARFDAGPAVGVDLQWSPGALDLRRIAVKDARSDVTVSLRSKGKVLEGRYAGSLDSRTIAAMLKGAKAPAGAVSGNLQFTVDREQPQRTAVEGTLKGENVDLSWLAGQPAKIERLDLAADPAGLRISEASVDWAGQRATLRGTGRRTDTGLVFDAQLESPGVVVDALLPKTKTASAKGEAADPWPLPATGKIALRSGFIQYRNYKVEPVAAVITLERERAQLEVNEAFLCGFALPARLEATPQGLAARTVIAAQNQKLEEAAECLAGDKLLLTGPVDLRAELRTQGRPDELLQNLSGTVSADVRNGTVTKFALLGNILSMQNVVALAQQGGPKLGAEAFPFRQLSARGRFDKGRFILDEGVFHSNAIGLGANGWISLSDFDTRLTVLVAPLALLDEGVRKIPLLGYVVGGAFTSLPVSVTGDIRDPTVVPLGPRAITNELTGILSRTLSLPGRVLPGAQER